MTVFGVPSYGLIEPDFWLCFDALWGRDRNVDTIVNHRSCYPTEGRNITANQAVDLNADSILFLDPDITFPPSTLVQLQAHNKDIVGATYTKRTEPYGKLGVPIDPTDNNNLQCMVTMPAGCLLIRTSVFAKMKRPYFRMAYIDQYQGYPNGFEIGEDINFCSQVRLLGFNIWCDMNLSKQIGHIGKRVFRHE